MLVPEEHAIAQDGEQPEQPTRRSARNATKTAKTYNDGSDVDKEEDEEEPGTRGSSPERPPQAVTTPHSRSEKGEWAASSPPFRQRRQRGRAWKAGTAHQHVCSDEAPHWPTLNHCAFSPPIRRYTTVLLTLLLQHLHQYHPYDKFSGRGCQHLAPQFRLLKR